MKHTRHIKEVFYFETEEMLKRIEEFKKTKREEIKITVDCGGDPYYLTQTVRILMALEEYSVKEIVIAWINSYREDQRCDWGEIEYEVYLDNQLIPFEEIRTDLTIDDIHFL